MKRTLLAALALGLCAGAPVASADRGVYYYEDDDYPRYSQRRVYTERRYVEPAPRYRVERRSYRREYVPEYRYEYRDRYGADHPNDHILPHHRILHRLFGF